MRASEWKIDSAFPTKLQRDKEYKKSVDKYGKSNVKKGNKKTYKRYGTVMPYQVVIRTGAKYNM